MLDLDIAFHNVKPKNYKGVYKMQNNSDLILRTYNIIDETANSDAMIEAISGFLGFPFTLIADGATVLTHYIPMLGKIRELNGKAPWTAESFGPIFKSLSSELLFDILVDKVLGQIPIAGIYFNLICAKSLTWRVGMLCAMCSCLQNDVTDIETLKKTSILIREIFPQRSIFKFAKPNYNDFRKVMLSIMNNDASAFGSKINKALEAFDI